MNIQNDITKYEIDSFEKLMQVKKFIQSIPMNIPVFFKCKCPNTSSVTNFLVIPEFFNMKFFHCTLLAIDNTEALKNRPSIEIKKEKIDLDIDSILSWETLNEEKSFLNFGNGFVTQRYLNMIIPA